jgi:hypothetical protein
MRKCCVFGQMSADHFRVRTKIKNMADAIYDCWQRCQKGKAYCRTQRRRLVALRGWANRDGAAHAVDRNRAGVAIVVNALHTRNRTRRQKTDDCTPVVWRPERQRERNFPRLRILSISRTSQ